VNPDLRSVGIVILEFIVDVVLDGVSAITGAAFRGRQRDHARQEDEEWAEKWAHYADEHGLLSVGKGRRLVEVVNGHRVLIDPGTWCDAPQALDATDERPGDRWSHPCFRPRVAGCFREALYLAARPPRDLADRRGRS